MNDGDRAWRGWEKSLCTTMTMQLAWLLGVSPRVAGGLCYLSDTEVQFAAGLTVVAYDPENGRQRCMLPSPPSGAATVSLTALALSESRR